MRREDVYETRKVHSVKALKAALPNYSPKKESGRRKRSSERSVEHRKAAVRNLII